MRDKNKFRSSFLSIFDNTLKFTWIAILVIITNFAIITNKLNEFHLNIDINLFLIILLFVFIICIFIYNLIIWRISRFEIKEKVIVIYKNIFIKDKKEFLINNISNICISQNVFERIFKLKRIRIFENQKNKLFCDFNVVLTNKNFNYYLIPFFYKNDVNIYDKKYKDNIKVKEKNKIKFNFLDILRHSFFSIPISSIIVIINFILLVFAMISSGTFLKEIIYNFLGLIITLIGFVLPVIYSMFKNIVKYINFSIKRENKHIVLTYGFFNRKQYIIQVSKIQGIIIDVSILSRIFRCYKLNVMISGTGDKKSELFMILPISRKNKCKEILNIILPEYNVEMNYKNQPYESIIIIGLKVLLILTILIIPIMFIYIQALFYLLLSLVILILFFYFNKKIGVSDKYISVITGFFVKRIRIINYDKIEKIEVKEDVISRKFGISKIYIYIFSDIKNTRMSCGYIKNKYI